jgi:serine/threonine protein kinase
MGIVWRAIDVRLERSVAVKQILAQPGLSEAERDNMRQRAMREAKNAARFQHPNAIVVFDIAEHGGDPCLVMEYLPGRSLSAVLAEQRTLPLSQVARIGEQVASALVAAHRAGIVHRDIKPGNILIDDNGTTKITDFGISRAAGDMALTQTGLIGGTPAYLAPELARGSDPVPSSDVFALGATLYQALEGQTPYGDTTNQLALLYAAANGNIVPPRQSGAATALLMSLLRSEPEERPTMAEARDRLATLAANEPTPPGTIVSPPLYSSGTGGRQPAGLLDTPGQGIPGQGAPHGDTPGRGTPAGGQRPPWQRVDSPAPSLPRTPTAAYLPTQARPAVSSPPHSLPTQVRRSQPRAGTEPDAKRKAALIAGLGAAVVVVAVVVFLVLSSNSGGTGTTAQPPRSTPGTSATAAPPSSAAPAALNHTPPDAAITDYQAAGLFLLSFFDSVGTTQAWNMLTPAAQAVYGGSESAFADYWTQHKITDTKTAKADSGGANDDGSISMSLTLNNGPRPAFRIIKSGGRLLIDSNTKVLN